MNILHLYKKNWKQSAQGSQVIRQEESFVSDAFVKVEASDVDWVGKETKKKLLNTELLWVI